MNPIDWSKLRTFDDWSRALRQLLDEANAAAVAKDRDRIKAVISQLGEFQDRSPNRMCRTLDEIALRAVKDLMAAAISDAVTNIASRSAELSQYLKETKAIVAENKQKTSTLRLDRAKDLVVASTNVIQAAVDLRAELKTSAQDKDLEERIAGAIAAVQNLRNAVESAPHS
jgi:hypothetical protein